MINKAYQRILKLAIKNTAVFIVIGLLLGSGIVAVFMQSNSLSFKPQKTFSNGDNLAYTSVQTLTFASDQVLFLYISRTEYQRITVFISSPEILSSSNVTRDAVINNYIKIKRVYPESSNTSDLVYLGLFKKGTYFITILFEHPFKVSDLTFPTPVNIYYVASTQFIFALILLLIFSVLMAFLGTLYVSIIILSFVYLIQLLLDLYNERNEQRPLSSTSSHVSTQTTQTTQATAKATAKDHLNYAVKTSPGLTSSESSSVPTKSKHDTPTQEKEISSSPLEREKSLDEQKSSASSISSFRMVYNYILNLPTFEIIMYFGAVFSLYMSLLFLSKEPIGLSALLLVIGVLYHIFYDKKRKRFLAYLKFTKRPITLKDAARFLGMSEKETITFILELNKEDVPLIIYDSSSKVLQYNFEGSHRLLSPVFSDSSQVSQEPSSTPPIPEYKCPFCGAVIQDPNAQFCSECGSSLLPAK